MEMVCKPVLGTVDKNWGVTPFYSKYTALESQLILTSKRWRSLRIPVLRRVVRLGLFVDPLENGTLVHSPRIVVQVLKNDAREATAIRFRHFKYPCSFNSMGGVFAAIQPQYGCMPIYEKFGVFVGILEWQFKYPLPKKMSLAVTVQHSWKMGGHGVFDFGIIE